MSFTSPSCVPSFRWRTRVGGALTALIAAWGACGAGELLPNGIRLPDAWPPRYASLKEATRTPPYLQAPPHPIPIDVGRQLFVDDFLIAECTLRRTAHRPRYRLANPVLRPDQPWEREPAQNPTAMTYSDGVFYDAQENRFKMWYMGGYVQRTCYAVSRDGIAWEKPSLDVVPGTNVVHTATRDSTSVWLDHTASDLRQRFKMTSLHWPTDYRSLFLYASADGIHWSDVLARSPHTELGDRHTAFYNPFRKVWVISLRSDMEGVGRMRRYREHADFVQAAKWTDEPVIWTGADADDVRQPGQGQAPQLYNLDCVAYESLMLGLFTIWNGERGVLPKLNDVAVGFSRDGFHWHRPDRQAFLPTSDREGAWNAGNVQSSGGCCLVVGDQLYFYVGGRQGVPGTRESGACSVGLATLRRDGFASLDADAAGGFVTTRPVVFSGSHLFVNAAADQGGLTSEVLDLDGRAIEPFSRANCRPMRNDQTRQAIVWNGADDLSTLSGRPVRFRFHLRNAHLYAFWVSSGAHGASAGYVAAGGPGFAANVDDGGHVSR